MQEKQQLRSVFFFTQVALTKSVILMKETLKWTGWNRKKNAVLRSFQLRQQPSGHQRQVFLKTLNIVSISLILQVTLILLLRLSVHFAFLMEVSQFWTQKKVFSRSQKPSGVRLTNTKCREFVSLTKWTSSEQIFCEPLKV